MTDFIDRMEVELADLDERIRKLSDFFETVTFKARDQAYRATISHQFLAMSQYASCLRLRLAFDRAAKKVAEGGDE